jgi:hypothetical protein
MHLLITPRRWLFSRAACQTQQDRQDKDKGLNEDRTKSVRQDKPSIKKKTKTKTKITTKTNINTDTDRNAFLIVQLFVDSVLRRVGTGENRNYDLVNIYKREFRQSEEKTRQSEDETRQGNHKAMTKQS